MKWFRIHVGFASHPKIIGLTDKAFRAHMSALEWTAAYEQDGALSPQLTAALPPAVRAELVKRGVWEADGDGYRIHDWQQWQTPISELQKKRDATRNRVKRYREGGNDG